MRERGPCAYCVSVVRVRGVSVRVSKRVWVSACLWVESVWVPRVCWVCVWLFGAHVWWLCACMLRVCEVCRVYGASVCGAGVCGAR